MVNASKINFLPLFQGGEGFRPILSLLNRPLTIHGKGSSGCKFTSATTTSIPNTFTSSLPIIVIHISFAPQKYMMKPKGIMIGSFRPI